MWWCNMTGWHNNMQYFLSNIFPPKEKLCYFCPARRITYIQSWYILLFQINLRSKRTGEKRNVSHQLSLICTVDGSHPSRDDKPAFYSDLRKTVRVLSTWLKTELSCLICCNHTVLIKQQQFIAVNATQTAMDCVAFSWVKIGQIPYDYCWTVGFKEKSMMKKHTVGHSCPATLPQNVAHGHQYLLLS